MQPAAGASRSTSRRNRVLTGAAWVVVVGLVVFVVRTLPASGAPRPGSRSPCTHHESGAGPGKELGQFLPHDADPQFSLDFGASRQPGSDYLVFDAYPGTPHNLDVDVWSAIERKHGPSIDDGTGLTLHATVHKAAAWPIPAVVRVCIAVDPSRIPHLKPGRYEGRIVLNAKDYRSERIPVVVTFRASEKRAFTLAFVGVVIGLVARCLAELASSQRSRAPGSAHPLRTYVSQVGFPLAIIFGVLTGYLGYVEIYDANPTWGVNGGQDTLKLLGTCFGFQMGSISGADLIKRVVG
jgi:hypothetical protein